MGKLIDLSKMTAEEQVRAVLQVSLEEFEKHAKWDEFTPEQWLNLLDLGEALFFDKCDWQKAAQAPYWEWQVLLSNHPEFADYFPASVFASWTQEEWLELVADYYHLVKFFPVDKLEPELQDWLLRVHPVFARIIANNPNDPLMEVFLNKILIVGKKSKKESEKADAKLSHLLAILLSRLSVKDSNALLTALRNNESTSLGIMPKSRADAVLAKLTEHAADLAPHLQMRPYQKPSDFFPQTLLEEAVYHDINPGVEMLILNGAKLTRSDALASPEAFALNIRIAMLLVENGIPDQQRQEFFEQLCEMENCHPEMLQIVKDSLKPLPESADLNDKEKELLQVLAKEDSEAIFAFFHDNNDLFLSWLPHQYYTHLTALSYHAAALFFQHLGFRLQPYVLKTLLANHDNPALLSLNTKNTFDLVLPLICEGITFEKITKEDGDYRREKAEDDLEEIPF